MKQERFMMILSFVLAGAWCLVAAMILVDPEPSKYKVGYLFAVLLLALHNLLEAIKLKIDEE